MTKKDFPFKRILVVDDSELDFLIVNTIIWRHEPSAFFLHARDVDQGVRMLKSFTPSEIPDLILLDLNFNGQKKQGADFLKEYEALPDVHKTGTKVVIITAYAEFNGPHSFIKDLPSLTIIEKPLSTEKLRAI